MVGRARLAQRAGESSALLPIRLPPSAPLVREHCSCNVGLEHGWDCVEHAGPGPGGFWPMCSSATRG